MAPVTRANLEEKNSGGSTSTGDVPLREEERLEEPTRAEEAKNEAFEVEEQAKEQGAELDKLRRDLEGLKEEIARLEMRSNASFRSEYERLASYNGRSSVLREPYRKPGLSEPQPFTGEELDENPYALRAWVKDVFDFVTLSFKGDEDTQVRYATRLLKGSPRTAMDTWVQQTLMKGEPLEMAEWANNLKNTLQPIDPAIRAQKAWVEIRMGPKEGAYGYFKRMHDIIECINSASPDAQVVPISEETFGMTYRHTLTPRLQARMEAQVRMILQNKGTLPTTPWKWMHLAVEIEANLRDEDKAKANRNSHKGKTWSRKPNVPGQGQGSENPSAQVGVVYQTPGYVKDNHKKKGNKREKKERTCYVCKEPGHFAAQCPKNGEAQAPN